MTVMRMPRRPDASTDPADRDQAKSAAARAQDPGTPPRMDALASADALIVRAFRHYVGSPDRPEEAWNAVAITLGGRAGKPVMGALIMLVERARTAARRQIRYHARCCPCLAPDEARLVALVATAGAGRMDRAVALAADFLALDARPPFPVAPEALSLAEAARGLARALARAGLTSGTPAVDGLSLLTDAPRGDGPLH